VPARTGAQYLTGLREQRREVWLDGRRVHEIVDEPAFRAPIREWSTRRPMASSSMAHGCWLALVEHASALAGAPVTTA
jgi:hypothetical protein